VHSEEKRLLLIASLEREYAHQLEKPSHWLGIAVCEGWVPIVRSLFARVDQELTPFELRRFRWIQVKQKWGGLRAYYQLDGKQTRLHVDLMTQDSAIHLASRDDDPLSAKIDNLVKEAAERAAQSCEMCGEPGEVLNLSGWIVVACPHHQDREKWPG
jgi:hypothetical protein